MHRQHLVHVADVDRDAAVRRVDVAFERGAGAERDDRHAMGRADAHDLLHVLGRLRKHHGVRRLVLDPGDGVAVLWRTAWEVTTRLPKRAVSARTAVSMALGSRRDGAEASAWIAILAG